MSASPVQQLARFGPDQCDSLSVEEARAWCRRLTRRHYENFSVLSALVPAHLRNDFAAVYAFCRWADDLGDEVGDAERALELLAWWRRELHACFNGEPRHPVFVALQPTIQQHELPIRPFDDLIRAFEQDQSVTRYETWAQVLDYCKLSADPVGRLVLMVCGESRDETTFALSDAICTALQLTNHWQDVNRDLLERDRIYLPRELTGEIPDFETRFRASAAQGYAVDRTFLAESRRVIHTCVERTWPMFEHGAKLLDRLGPSSRPVVWLLAAGGQHVLRQIEYWNYETVLHRPRLGKFSRIMLVAQAWCRARLSFRGAKRNDGE
ncbi:MAG: squalene synthase HpnC [Phycisphaerales bacterium]|nr:MAG: squalene synthase HpnC [Phycisphaerales bacterium]